MTKVSEVIRIANKALLFVASESLYAVLTFPLMTWVLYFAIAGFGFKEVAIIKYSYSLLLNHLNEGFSRSWEPHMHFCHYKI